MQQHITFPLRVFGLQNVVVRFENAIAPSQFIPVTGLTSGYQQPDEPDFISPLGTPVYGSLQLGNTDPNNTNGNQYTGVDGKVYTYQTMTLSQAIIIVNLKKVITKTKVVGWSHGSIKEYIGLDDFDVTIHANIDKPAGVAPKDEMAQLSKLGIAEVPIPVTSYFLNQFGIYQIVIEDIYLPQEIGKYSSQAFTIRACSDYDTKQMLP